MISEKYAENLASLGRCGFWILFVISCLEKDTQFSKLDLFPSSGDRETPAYLGVTERGILNH